ncbi:MAG: hypothetical protein H7831_05910 [Magnetococcus sp. WYHC-3]
MMRIQPLPRFSQLPEMPFEVDRVFTAETYSTPSYSQVETLALGVNHELALVVTQVSKSVGRHPNSLPGQEVRAITVEMALTWMKRYNPKALAAFKKHFTVQTTRHIQIRITQELYQRTQRVAKQVNLSRAELTRRLLIEGMDRIEGVTTSIEDGVTILSGTPAPAAAPEGQGGASA